MSDRPSAEAPARRAGLSDPASRQWVEQLHAGHPRHEQAVARLHDILRRAAAHELRRRRGQVRSLAGPELDDVAQQCADDAVVNILARIDDFQGLSRFTTWAYKFVIFEVSSKLARHAWRREQLSALKNAIEHDLTSRQREIFAAIALNDVPIDVPVRRDRAARRGSQRALPPAPRSTSASAPDAAPTTTACSRPPAASATSTPMRSRAVRRAGGRALISMTAPTNTPAPVPRGAQP